MNYTFSEMMTVAVERALDNRDVCFVGIGLPSAVLLVTALCVMQPDPETNEFVVTSLHPEVSREQVSRNSGWAVRFSTTLLETEPPTGNELEALRTLHEQTARAHIQRSIA